MLMLTLLILPAALAQSPQAASTESMPVPELESLGEVCPMTKHANVEPGFHLLRGDMVNLRTGPSLESEPVVELRMATVVRTGACEKQDTVAGVSGCWHPVTVQEQSLAFNQLDKPVSGYLFSTAMIDCGLSVDWDDDGTKEIIFHALRGNGELQVRVMDPNNAPHVFWGVAAKGVDEYSGEFRVMSKKQAGQTLLVVAHHGGEFCGSGSQTDYFSYSPTGGMQMALSTFSFGDAPVYHYRQAVLSPEGRAQVTEELFDDSGPPERTESILCLSEGVYKACTK